MCKLWSTLPKGSKPTSRVLQRGVFEGCALYGKRVLVHKDLEGQDHEVILVGVPRSLTEFMAAAESWSPKEVIW